MGSTVAAFSSFFFATVGCGGGWVSVGISLGFLPPSTLSFFFLLSGCCNSCCCGGGGGRLCGRFGDRTIFDVSRCTYGEERSWTTGCADDDTFITSLTGTVSSSTSIPSCCEGVCCADSFSQTSLETVTSGESAESGCCCCSGLVP